VTREVLTVGHGLTRSCQP